MGLLLILLCGGWYAWDVYKCIYHPNTYSAGPSALLIPSGSVFEDVVDSLDTGGILISSQSFRWVARQMHYDDDAIKPGHYVIDPSTSNYDLIQKLRIGAQDPVDLIIHSSRTVEDLAGRIATQLEMDSAGLMSYLDSTYIPMTRWSQEDILTLFIPNTYEVYWNLSPKSLIQRMETEHARFWNPERRSAAEVMGLTPEEVYTLASIVERETQADAERTRVAGVYYNRIKNGMLLRADPTVIFAMGDFTIKRVLHKHLEFDSPYNTYLYAGLPPGPITMPSMASLEAALQPESHNYLYFCVKPGGNGSHVFAETLSAHLRNARAYHRWLDNSGIR
jgi:UPF0755 protein